jgi:predicted ArsR family transcriptional regulator
MDIPILEQVKIQAQVLVPLVKALQVELGEERANTLVRSALSGVYRAYGEKWWQTLGDQSLAEKVVATFSVYSAQKSLVYDVIQHAPDEVEVNVTECRFAKFYKLIGAPELGFLLTCSSDYPMAEGFGSDVEFTRTQTIMQGASHCDFRYRLRRDGGA